MGQISINLTDKDKQALKQEAQKQKKSLSELCRERILNTKDTKDTKDIATTTVTTKNNDVEEVSKKLTTINKNIMVLFNEIKALQQSHIEMKKQVFYNSSYLYFLTHELFADNPEIANEIDKKIQQVKLNKNKAL